MFKDFFYCNHLFSCSNFNDIPLAVKMSVVIACYFASVQLYAAVQKADNYFVNGASFHLI